MKLKLYETILYFDWTIFTKKLSDLVGWKFELKLYFISYSDERRKLEENEPDEEEGMFSIG